MWVQRAQGEGDLGVPRGLCVLPCRKNVTESPSFSAGDNPHVLYSSDFRISGAPDKYEVRARAPRL